jgi:hypothetical protein
VSHNQVSPWTTCYVVRSLRYFRPLMHQILIHSLVQLNVRKLGPVSIQVLEHLAYAA